MDSFRPPHDGWLAERWLNLNIALRVAHELRLKDIDVTLTRTLDCETVSLAERAAIAKRSGADIFVSLHCNSFSNPSARGVEACVYPGDVTSAALGRALVTQVCGALQVFNRGVKNRPDLGVLREARRLKVPMAVLLEAPFLSNPADARILADKYCRQAYAVAVARVIADRL